MRKKKNGVKVDCKVFDLSIQMDKLPQIEMEKSGRVILAVKLRVAFGYVSYSLDI